MSMRNLGLPWNEGEYFSKCPNKVRDGSVYVAELITFFPLRLWTFEGQRPKDGLTIFSVSSMFPSGMEVFAFHALCLLVVAESPSPPPVASVRVPTTEWRPLRKAS